MKKLILFAISFIAAVLIFAVAVSSVPASLPFSDVPEDAWFYGAVADAYEAGLVKGKSGTVFAPDDNVTRAEVAAMLSRLDGTDVSEYGLYAAAFTDAAEGSWYREYVGWAAFSGILKGYPDGTVRPDADVTRAELSAMIKRYVDGKGADLPADPQTDVFSDADAFDDWFSGAAEEMRTAGLLKGYEDGSMIPSAPATRAEVATVFVRLSRSLDVAGKTVLLASEYKNTKAILIFDPDFEITGHKRYEAYVEDFIGVIKDGTGYDIHPHGDVLPRRKKEIVLACNRPESVELCDGIGGMEFRIRVISDEKGESLVLGYANYFSYGNAVDYLVSNFMKNGELRVPKDLDYSATVPPVYGEGDYTLIESGIRQLRDPFVLVEDGVSYMYGTGWIMYKNTTGDLSGPWDGPYPVVEYPADFKTDYWAPEVYKYNGRYWMFTSYVPAGSDLDGVAIFSSDSPEGPFRFWSEGLITPRDKDCIDASFYVDKSGDPWLVFCLEYTSPEADDNGSICAARLSGDLKELITEPVTLFSVLGSPWSNPARQGLCEGPYLWRLEDGGLIAIWSGLDGCGYAVGVARSDNGEITGNWTHEESPIYSLTLTGIYDGGHGMIFRAADGELYLTVHAPNVWDASMIGPDGRGAMPIFIRLSEEGGSVVWDIP